MAWGDEKCMWCEKLVNGDLTSACQCRDRLTYRKEPEAPTSAMRMYYDAAEPRHTNWQLALQAFEKLPAQERRAWDAKADADRARFEREKMEYNDNLALDDELLTDNEEEGRMECGNAVDEIRQALQRRRCEQQWARYRRDHWAFSTHSRSDVGPAALHRFRDLPTEIRIQIYTQLFDARGSPEALRQWQLEYESADTDPNLRFTHLQPLDTRILAASRQIHAEALDALYSTRCFTVDVARASAPPLFIRKPTGVVAPRPTSKIKRWHIRLTFTDVLHKEFILPQLHLVHDAMKDCIALDEVRFSWISVPDYWSEVLGLRREYDDMLSLFKDIQGVKKVVFTEGFDGYPSDVKKYSPALLCGWDNMHLASEHVRREVKTSMESPR